MKKFNWISNIIIIFLICITSFVFTGCSSSKELEGYIEKINKGKADLISQPNINFSKTVLSEILEEKHTSLSEVVIDNESNEWYISHAAVIESDIKVFSESLLANGKSYVKNLKSSNWELSETDSENTALKFLDTEPLTLTSKDCKDIKILKEGDNEVITLVLSSSYLKKLKKKNISNLESILNNFKADETTIENSKEVEELSLEALKKTNYQSCELTFILNQNGFLIGQKSFYILEQPTVDTDSQGKMFLHDAMETLTMTSEIKVTSYDDNKNKALINTHKAEL